MLVEDAFGGLQGSIGWDGNVRRNAGALPRRPCRSVRVDSGDAEEDAGLTDLVDLGRVGRPGCGLADDHGSAQLLHDVNELLCGAGGGSAGQDDQAFLGAITHT